MKTEAFLCLRNILIWLEINVFSYWKFLSLIVSSDVTACLLYWLTVFHFDFMFYVVNKVVTANTETMWCLHLLILSYLNKVELNVKSSSHNLELKPKNRQPPRLHLRSMYKNEAGTSWYKQPLSCCSVEYEWQTERMWNLSDTRNISKNEGEILGLVWTQNNVANISMRRKHWFS